MNKYNPNGVHYLLEFWDCDIKQINSLAFCKKVLFNSAKKAELRIIKYLFHKFKPSGITGILLLSSSHLSIHTWPEHGYAGIDLFSCGKNIDIKKGIDYIIKNISHQKRKIKVIKRGYSTNA